MRGHGKTSAIRKAERDLKLPFTKEIGNTAGMLGPNDVRLLSVLRRQGYLPDGSAVIELGTQQLSEGFLASKNEIKELGELFNASQPFHLPTTSASSNIVSFPPYAREFWQWLGFEYASIDIDGESTSIPLDLNYDDVPNTLRNRYKLVTNFGTSEHVVNQFHAFKIVHDLTALEGIMIHNVPCQGMLDHGLFSYNPKFFWALARSNGYKLLCVDLPTATPAALPDDVATFIAGFMKDFNAQNYRARECSITVVLQKEFDIEYVAPLDVDHDASGGGELMMRRYWTVLNPDAFLPFVVSKIERDRAAYEREQAVATRELDVAMREKHVAMRELLLSQSGLRHLLLRWFPWLRAVKRHVTGIKARFD